MKQRKVISTVSNDFDFAESHTERTKLAEAQIKRWKTNSFLKKHDVNIRVIRPRCMYGDGFATQYQLLAFDVPAEGELYTNFLSSLRNLMAECKIEASKTADCRFDIFQPIECKTFTKFHVCVDLIWAGVIICVLLVFIMGMSFAFPVLPGTEMVRALTLTTKSGLETIWRGTN